MLRDSSGIFRVLVANDDDDFEKAASSSIGISVSVTAVAFSLHQMPVICFGSLFFFSPFIPTENLYLFYTRGADCKVYHINLSSFSSAHTAGVECVVS